MNNDEYNGTIDNETPDPVASAKAIYLAALSEYELLKPACNATGISIAQVWDWRARDVEFDDEIRRIWSKDKSGFYEHRYRGPTVVMEIEHPIENYQAKRDAAKKLMLL